MMGVAGVGPGGGPGRGADAGPGGGPGSGPGRGADAGPGGGPGRGADAGPGGGPGAGEWSVDAPGRDPAVAAIIVFLGSLALLQAGTGALLPFLTTDLDLTLTASSLHIAGIALGGLVVALTAESVRARMGRRAMLMAAAGLVVLGGTLLASAPNGWVSAAAMVIVGAAMGAVLITGQSLIAVRHPLQVPTRIGQLNVGHAVGALAATMLVPLVAEATHWRVYPAIGAGLALFVVLPLVSVTVRGPGATDRAPVRGAPAVSLGGRLTGLVVLTTLVEWSLLYWTATFLVDAVGLSDAVAAGTTVPLWATFLVGRVVGTALVARTGARVLLAFSLLLAAGAVAALQVVPGPRSALLATTLAGLAAANAFPALTALVVQAAPDRADAAIARSSVISSTTAVVTPVVVGVIGDLVGLRWAFAVIGTVALLGSLLAVRSAPRPSPHPGGNPADRTERRTP